MLDVIHEKLQRCYPQHRAIKPNYDSVQLTSTICLCLIKRQAEQITAELQNLWTWFGSKSRQLKQQYVDCFKA